MPYHYLQRLALVGAARTAVGVPSDGVSREKVSIGNATADDLKIDMGSAGDYVVIVAGGWHDYSWPKHKLTPQGCPDGVAFYATAVASGTMVLEWT